MMALWAGLSIPVTAARAEDRPRSLRSGHGDLISVAEEPLAAAPLDPDDAQRIEELLRAPPDGPTRTRWYGWETLMSDGLSVATFPIYVGAGGFFLAPPILHASHGRWGAAGVSLALRVALPLAGGLFGDWRDDCTLERKQIDGGCGIPGATIFFAALGAITAITIDAAVLSYEQVPLATARTTSTVSVAVVPWIDRARRGASLAITF
jgi:hypothetical protein